MGALYVLMRKRLGAMDGQGVGLGLLHALIGTAVLSAAVVLFSQLELPAWSAAIGGVTLGAAAYLIVMRLLRVPELLAIHASLMRRLRS
jgi:membrane associated rhomboid family serine protease